MNFFSLIPDRCSVQQAGKQCVNPPTFVISIIVGQDEYMVGVTCQKHKESVRTKIFILQEQEKIPKGKINFSELKPVGTDCIKANPDDLIQID